MTYKVLLNIHRKNLHDVLLEENIDPLILRWTNEKKQWTNDEVDTLEVGVCHFLFNSSSSGTFSIHMKPGSDGGAERGLVNLNWEDVLEYFQAWAFFVKKELQQDDPWQYYNTYLPPENLANSGDNSPFTHNEAEHAATAIADFLSHIQNTLTEYSTVAERFNPQFNRLITQAKQGAGRIDWSNQFVGTLISLCIALSLEPEKASSLWQFWKQLIAGFLLS